MILKTAHYEGKQINLKNISKCLCMWW